MIPKDYLFVKDSPGRLFKVRHADITHIEGDKDYCLIHAGPRKPRINIRLDKLLTYLPADMFFRCHKSFIVNVDRIEMVNNDIIVIGEKLIPVAEPSRTALLVAINYVHSTYEDKMRVK